MSAEVQEALQQHWGLDEQASQHLAGVMDAYGGEERIGDIVERLDPDAVRMRDENRSRVGKIYTRESPGKLIVVGGCSADSKTDYGPLFDFIEEEQEAHPDDVMAARINGGKPRTNKGWTGMIHSLDPGERERLSEILHEAFNRGIPILSEITQCTQLGEIAPYLTGPWTGTRDMQSTAIRGLFAAYNGLPSAVKNSSDGSPKTVKNAIIAIRANSAENENSGVNIGTVASRGTFPGIATGLLPVGEGNKQIAIIARGHSLPEEMEPEERRVASINHLSSMCIVGASMGSAVLLDGSHDVPKMLAIDPKDSNRLVEVLRLFHDAIESGEIKNPEQLAGLLGEASPTKGRTDPNYILDKRGRVELSTVIKRTLQLL